MAKAIMTGTAMDRLTAFSDGVVGVAVTVMIVPIFDTPGPQPDESMLDVLQDNVGNVIAYVFTFYVVVMLWLAHHRVFNELRAYDSRVVILNTVWLMTIGFLPWPSYLIGEGDGIERGIGVLYFGLLALSVLMLWLMSEHVQRNQDLLNPEARGIKPDNRRSIVFFTMFAVMAVVSLYSTLLINLLALSLPFISFLLRPKGSAEMERPVADDATADGQG